MELPPSLGLLRCIRALRVFRLFKRVASLKSGNIDYEDFREDLRSISKNR